MPQPTDRFQTNITEVAAKVMDGEAVMINLSDGSYYSMDGVGGTLWELISGGLSVQEVVNELTARFDVTEAIAQRDVEQVIDDLLREKLVLPGAGAPGSPLPASPVDRLPYSTPRLVIYRDMQQLLALDPPMPGMDSLPYSKSAR